MTASDSPPEGDVEGERAIALDEDQEEDWWTQAHDECAADSGCIQGGRSGQKRKYANDCQHHYDDPPSAQMPAKHTLKSAIPSCLQFKLPRSRNRQMSRVAIGKYQFYIA